MIPGRRPRTRSGSARAARDWQPSPARPSRTPPDTAGLGGREQPDLVDLAVSVALRCADIGDRVPDLREDEDSLTVVAKTHVHRAERPRRQLEGALAAARASRVEGSAPGCTRWPPSRGASSTPRENDTASGRLIARPDRDPESEGAVPPFPSSSWASRDRLVPMRAASWSRVTPCARRQSRTARPSNAAIA